MNDTITQDDFVERTVEWVNRVLAPPGTTVGADTPLFGGGVINSIRILELIAWTERAIDRTIPDREICMQHFRTIRRIAEVFVQGTAVSGAVSGAVNGGDDAAR